MDSLTQEDKDSLKRRLADNFAHLAQDLEAIIDLEKTLGSTEKSSDASRTVVAGSAITLVALVVGAVTFGHFVLM